jgi:hypothetical protein
MNVSKKLKIVVLTIAIAFVGMEFGEQLSLPGFHGFATPAEAWVGRPMTPFSVAGVARRSVRRCYC